MLEGLQPYQGLIALVVTLSLGLVAWAFRTNVQRMVADRASAEQMRDVQTKLDDVDRRVIGIEQQIEALPTVERMNRLAIDMETLRGDFRTLTAELRGTNDLLRSQARKIELMDEYLRRIPSGGGGA
jgi:peptidoglycan hydrolase CwlO-like protein